MSKGQKGAVSMSEAEYVEVFLDPAMQLIAEEKADTLGSLLVRWICTGEQPELSDEDDKLCWNLLMMRLELMFNPQVSISDFINGSDEEKR